MCARMSTHLTLGEKKVLDESLTYCLHNEWIWYTRNNYYYINWGMIYYDFLNFQMSFLYQFSWMGCSSHHIVMFESILHVYYSMYFLLTLQKQWQMRSLRSYQIWSWYHQNCLNNCMFSENVNIFAGISGWSHQLHGD